MKICVAFCVLSLINSVWTLPTHGVDRPALTSVEGIIETLYYSNSTTSLTLNCSCTNELIQWIANGSRCSVFHYNKTLSQSNHTLCSACTRTNLTLTSPFVSGSYVCIGTGGTSCHHRWFLLEQNFSYPSTSLILTHNPTAKQFSYLPLLGFLAFICLVTAHYFLIYLIYTYY